MKSNSGRRSPAAGAFARLLIMLAFLAQLLAAPAFAQDTLARSLANQAKAVAQQAQAAAADAGLISQSGTLTSFLPNIPTASLTGLDLGTITTVRRGGRWAFSSTRTPEDVFRSYSTALDTTNVFYVSLAAGSNANNCTTIATPCLYVSNAIALGNATAAPYRIIVTGSTLPVTRNNRSTSFNTAAGSVFPTQDFALVLRGGTGIFTTEDNAVTWTQTDAVNAPTVWQYSVSNIMAGGVVDVLGTPDKLGNRPRLAKVADLAAVKATPGSYALVSGVLYVRRADGAPVTTANTAAFRQVAAVLKLAAHVNGYIGSDDGSTWEFWGGGNTGGGTTGGAISIEPTDAVPATRKITMITSVVARYGYRGFASDGWHGAVVAWGVTAGAAATDCYNQTNTKNPGAADALFLTFNADCYGGGIAGETSNNAYTSHTDAKLGVLGGVARDTAGGMIRSIGTSITGAWGVVLDNDRGDVWAGGTTPPELIHMSDTAAFSGTRLDFVGAAGSIAAINAGTGILSLTASPLSPLRTRGVVVIH